MKLYPNLRGELGSHVRLFNLPMLLRNELVTLLTFPNPAYHNASRYSPWDVTRIPQEISYFADYGDYVQIPRGFNPSTLSSAAQLIWGSIGWTDRRATFSVKFPPSQVTPNADQEQITRRFLRSLRDSERPFGTYLLVAPTSAGKTIAQGLLASITGERTLVLCKSNLIKKAWIDDMYLLYGMNEQDLGSIQQKEFRLGTHVTLASIATISRRKHLWTELFAQIGCLIIDEVQIIGADTIREIVEHCPAKFILGMTATPSRRDGKGFVLNSFIGRPLLRIMNKQRETESSFPLADAKTIQTNFRFDDSEGVPLDRDDLDMNLLIDAMTCDEERNKLLVREVQEDYAKGHSILVSTPRIKHVHHLAEMLTKAGLPANVLTGTTNGNKFYTEKLFKMVMQRKCRILVASTQAIKLGANLNPLDRLHVFIPPLNPVDLEQLIGRIRRKYPGKKDAQLRWYHDIQCPYLHRKFKSVFFPVMRKLRVARFENLFVA